MENNKQLTKPFSMVTTDEDVRRVEGEEAVARRHANMIKPVVIDEKASKKKYYIILFEIANGECENERTFEYFEGTTAELYEYLVTYMGKNNDVGVFVDKSKILVDSKKITIKNAITIYQFMKNAVSVGAIAEESQIDIEQFHEEDDEDKEE